MSNIKKTNKKVNKKNIPTRSASANNAYKNKKYSKKQYENKRVKAIVFLGVAILILACLLIPGKNVWLFFRNTMFGLFSYGSYILPIILIYIAYVYDDSKEVNNIKNILGICISLFLLLLVFYQILFGADILEVNGIFDFISSAFNDGVKRVGGGLISAILAWPLLKFFGFGGAVAVTLILIFVLVMLLSKITLADLFKVATVPAKKIEQVRLENRVNKAKKTVFDIPLDDMPRHPVESNKVSINKKVCDDTLKKTNEFAEKDAKFVEFDDFDNIKKSKVETIATENIEDDNHRAEIFETEDDDFIEFNLENLSINKDDKIDEDLVELSMNFEHTENQMKNRENQVDEYEDIDSIINHKIEESKNFENDDLNSVDDVSKNLNEQFDFSYENSQIKNEQNNEINFMEEKQYKNVGESESYVFPSTSLLNSVTEKESSSGTEELKLTAQKLVDTLKSFGVTTKLLDCSKGPAVTRYELQPASGVKISKITGLADDIALNLAAAGVRIEAPIPNKAAVGIEVPNKVVSVVSIKEMLDSKEFKNSKSNLAVALGKDISGNIAIADIAKMPHILIAGSTGSGKSVCINSIIISLIYKSSPDDVRLLMIDPKVVELGVYNDIPHLLIPVVTDPKKAAGALNWAVGEMLKRYKVFADNSVRDLKGYNILAQTREDLNPLPQIVIIIDELADLMMVAPNEIEDSICRLAQMARAAGMHLVIATQRPSVDVITGIIKANIPSRIAFAVSSQVDSRTIIDSSGAEKLLGRGDMLFCPIGAQKPTRVQGCFVSDKEVENVVAFIKNSYQSDYDDEISEAIEKLVVIEKKKSHNSALGESERDEMFMSAVECAVENGEISTSFLQRKLKLGYSRAARLIDEMENQGIVGPKEGSKPRKTLISRQQFVEMNLNSEE